LGLAVQANASWYDISFSGSDHDGAVQAFGKIEVVGGIAEAGWLDVSGAGAGNNVSAGVNGAGVYTLVPGTGLNALTLGPATFFYNNVVDPGSTPFTYYLGLPVGLAWENTADDAAIGLYNLGDAQGDYTLVGETDGAPTGFSSEGDAWLHRGGTCVPEPTTILSGALMLLPFGASTLRILRRKLT
jgi:hypothetical protein